MTRGLLRLGIDEAGRGCVLGPMVFGACMLHEADERPLRALGVRDSKKLSAKKRTELRQVVMERAVSYRVVALAPAELDATSLGELTKRVIVRLAEELRPEVLVLDAPVPPKQIPRYVVDIRARLAAVDVHGIEIVAENGADDTHPCCSAASVLAKTHRDATLAELEAGAGEPLGSGYPSDPVTQAFLRRAWLRHRRFPPFVRMKWETVRRIMAEDAQQGLFSGGR